MPSKVSILMLTYNQEQYVGQAIESILTQKVNFIYQIVIGEDCSTDRTGEICQKFKARYPDKIRLLEREKNLGMAGNFFATLKECDGQYLAILEGDDFWIDPLKLQKQADFLDAHPEYALVFGRTLTFYQEDGHLGQEIPPPEANSYALEDLLRNNFIATCSVMYRNGLVSKFPDWLGKLEMLDWPTHILHAQLGKIGFIDNPVARYRIHAQSNYSSRKKIVNYRSILKFYRAINLHLGTNYAPLIYRLQCWVCREISKQHLSEKQLVRAGFYFVLAVYYRGLSYLPSSIIQHLRVM
jgi:glycosyltransferase involved in cell wall biosynthesis